MDGEDGGNDCVGYKVKEGIYFPQLAHEQSEPQLQLEVPEHPHSPFMMIDFWGLVLVFGGGSGILQLHIVHLAIV